MAVDLYAGAGGLSFGMEQAGFDVLTAAEFDPIHALTHRYNMPATPVLCSDLSENAVDTTSKMILSLVEDAWRTSGRQGKVQIDAVVGGPPCQGFSVGGVRDSADDRNDQLLRFVDLVVSLKPKVFCLENVAGLLESRFSPIRDEAIRRLTVEGGYSLAGLDTAVNASDYGVPQSRRRVLILGTSLDDVPEISDFRSAAPLVGDALEGLPDLARYRRLLRSDEVILRDADYAALVSVESKYARQIVGVETDPLDKSYPRAYSAHSLTGSLRTVHTKKTVQRFSRTPQGKAEPISRLFRLDPAGFARTLRAGTGTDRGSHTSPRPIHPYKNRVVTVREAARLHGYPDWFRFHTTNWHGHRQVGNSVPPPLGAAAGRALISALGITLIDRPNEVLELGRPEWLRMSGVEAAKVIGIADLARSFD
ncbi:DNA cytosine methyltransferase [Oerskovia jenensis]|uniref:DNA cytosine methyltransferase n=1 Tax=Oerskovia jenensis TaxID=162169 RepID=UPI00355777E2